MQSAALSLTIAGPLANLRVGPPAAAARPCPDLQSAVQAVADDPAIRCVLLTIESAPPEAAGPPAFRNLETLPQPVIAVIDGPCHGPALELALACDIRVASAAATFAMPQLAAGAMPALGGTQRLPRLIGRTRATEMLLLGDPIDADTAYAWGLVNHVAPPGEASARAEAIANIICERGPIAVAYAKEALVRGPDMPLDQALRFETDLTIILQTTVDRAEGVRAFKEKRPPTFRGE